MQLPDKADLQNGLIKKVPVCVVTDQQLDVLYVVDGGALLRASALAKVCLVYQYLHTLHQLHS